MTIIEVLIGMALFGGLLVVVFQILQSSSSQEKQLVELSGLQREARRALELLQRDARGMQKLEALRRDKQGQLETLVMVVPTSEAPTQEVRYVFNPAAHVLTRNGETVLAESVRDVQIWPFDGSKIPQEILKADELRKVAFFKVRLSLARASDESGSGPKIFDFLVYPRVPASARKARESRLNQADSRFAPERIREE